MLTPKSLEGGERLLEDSYVIQDRSKFSFQSPDTYYVQFTLQLDNTHNPEVQILSILQHFFRWNCRPWAAQARPALRPKAASLLVWTGGPQGPESGLHKAL